MGSTLSDERAAGCPLAKGGSGRWAGKKRGRVVLEKLRGKAASVVPAPAPSRAAPAAAAERRHRGPRLPTRPTWLRRREASGCGTGSGAGAAHTDRTAPSPWGETPQASFTTYWQGIKSPKVGFKVPIQTTIVGSTPR